MKKAGFLLLLLAVLAVGCDGGREREPEMSSEERQTEVAFIGKEEKSTNLLREYYALLMTTTNQEEVYRFLETHIQEAEPKDADQLVKGLLNYLADADAADYDRLSKQEPYLTVEMQEYIELMKQEQPETAKLPEMLAWAEKLEKHARTYPEGVTFLYVYEKFCETVYTVVTEYEEEEAARTCQEFIEANPGTHLAEIMREYVDLLENSKGESEKQLAKYRANIYNIIKENFTIEA